MFTHFIQFAGLAHCLHMHSTMLNVVHTQVSVPDVHPAELIQRPGLLSMCAGDFVEVYSALDQAASFDCVATCFFLDTAHNILQYMQIIRHILKVTMHIS